MLTDQERNAICSHVVRILREERQRRRISMTALAKRAGLSQAMISFVEHEMRNPTLDTLMRMSQALELNLGEIIGKAYLTAGVADV